MKRLLVGYKASDLNGELLAGDTVCHTLDIYHAHAIEKTHPGAKVVCSAHLPEGGWDEILFRTGPKLMSGELSLDLMQEIHLLSPRSFKLDFVGRERDRNDLLNKIKNDPGRVRDFSAVWPASVPGSGRLMFTSVPGCFCHRRLDEGGLALAEVAAKELSQSAAPRRLLDMGCGCGLVGFLIANAVPGTKLTMIDSHTRAVEAAKRNSENFSIPARIHLADDGIASLEGAAGAFDVFVGNPPYYSDYRIADVFLETAKAALKPGGVCYTVVKNDAGLKPVQERYFPEVEVIRRRGYCVLKSVSVS
ncbi:MAG: methyltransferase [Kiritimatiellae bacterium]|nr:methyltransferase [Kiritimatiellia bacterium]